MSDLILDPTDVPRIGLERRIDVALDRPALELRDDSDGTGPGTLVGHAAVFNTLTTIRSYWEGNFRERMAPGAFTKTIAERFARIRCIYEHGYDPMFGTKPLGGIERLAEDGVGLAYTVPLFDTQLNREHVAIPARAGQLGASFAMDILGEEWDDDPADGGLPIRTITEVRLYEFGPCPFGAYADATAGMRSAVASWSHLSPARRAMLEDALATHRTPHASPAGLTTGDAEGAANHTRTTPADGHVERTISAEAQRQTLIALGITD